MGRMKKAEHALLSRCGSLHPNCKWGGGPVAPDLVSELMSSVHARAGRVGEG